MAFMLHHFAKPLYVVIGRRSSWSPSSRFLVPETWQGSLQQWCYEFHVDSLFLCFSPPREHLAASHMWLNSLQSYFYLSLICPNNSKPQRCYSVFWSPDSSLPDNSVPAHLSKFILPHCSTRSLCYSQTYYPKLLKCLKSMCFHRSLGAGVEMKALWEI